MIHAIPNPKLLAFYTIQRRVVSTELKREVSTHKAFATFFIAQNSPTGGPMPTFKVPIIDPGAIISDFASPVIRLAILRRPFESLAGFPFWEVLMFWRALRQRALPEHPKEKAEIRPTVSFSDDLLRVVNWDDGELAVDLKPPCGPLSRASLPGGPFTELDSPLRLPPGVSYLKGDGLTAETRVTFPGRPRARPEVSEEYVTESELHEFEQDMGEFALRWTTQDWNDLRSCLSPESLHDIRFGPSPPLHPRLANRPPVVIDLKRLLLHHVHYISHEHRDKVPDGVWELVHDLIVVGQDPRQTFLAAIATAEVPYEVQIECRVADRLRVLRTGPPSNAIIWQFAYFVQQGGADAFRGKNEVMKIALINPDVPVSDPLAYFLEKAVASVFEPTSQLMIACKTDPVCFIPWAQHRKPEIFRAIGVLIGIIVRTGRYQKFPLATPVWKFLVGEEITKEDILDLDRDLRARQNAKPGDLQWHVPNWDGKVVVLSGHADDPTVQDTDGYIIECVSFRKSEMNPFLIEIRGGLQANLGIVKSTVLTPPLLRELVNGP
jgi:hypothetical protein